MLFQKVLCRRLGESDKAADYVGYFQLHEMIRVAALLIRLLPLASTAGMAGCSGYIDERSVKMAVDRSRQKSLRLSIRYVIDFL